MSTTITISRATAEDMPALVDLFMMVEAEHEAYSTLRWKTKPGIREGYLKWMPRHLTSETMLLAVARDPAAKAPPQIPLAVFHPDTSDCPAEFSGFAPNPTNVVGAIMVGIMDEIPIYAYTHYAYIHDLAVALDYRRRGLATRLLNYACEWSASKGMPHLRLMVAAGNPEARAAFDRAGFKPTYNEMILPLTSRSES